MNSKPKVSEIISDLQKLMDEYGDLEFGVYMPPIGLVGFAIGGIKNNKTGEVEAIMIQPTPDIEQAVDAILNGGDEKPPCDKCDDTSCPKHPTKLN